MTTPDPCPTCGASRSRPAMVSIAFDSGRPTGRAFPVGAPNTWLYADALGLDAAQKAAADLIAHIRYVTPKGAPSTNLLLAERLEQAMKQIGGG